MRKEPPNPSPAWARLLGLCLLAACPRQEERAEPLPEVREPEPREHFAEIERARDALVDGDLPTATAQGASLAARLPMAGLPPAAMPHQEALREQALALAAAPDLASAANAVGRLSAECGGCHQATGAAVRLAPLPAPPQDEGFGAQMQRYHWSVQRMWQGLAQPDPAAAAEALAALNHLPAAPFRPDWLEEMPAAGERMDEAIHSLAADAAADGEAYGRLLASCAACHREIREGGE